jgi:hypothetical protein
MISGPIVRANGDTVVIKIRYSELINQQEPAGQYPCLHIEAHSKVDYCVLK